MQYLFVNIGTSIINFLFVLMFRNIKRKCLVERFNLESSHLNFTVSHTTIQRGLAYLNYSLSFTSFRSWKYLKECVWLPKIFLNQWSLQMQQMCDISWHYTRSSLTSTSQILGVLFFEKWNLGIKQIILFFSLIKFPDFWEPIASVWLN